MVNNQRNLLYIVLSRCVVIYSFCFYNKIGGAFVFGDALMTLEMFIDWIKTWKSNHGVNTQILSLEYGKLKVKSKINYYSNVIYLIYIKSL